MEDHAVPVPADHGERFEIRALHHEHERLVGYADGISEANRLMLAALRGGASRAWQRDRAAQDGGSTP